MDAGAVAEAGHLVTGPSYWQVGVALVAVLGLLVVVLKLLQRWQGSTGAGDDVSLLSVRRLGMRRELQVLRVGEQVHTIYRHESAMVLLATESREAHAANRPVAPAAKTPLGRRLFAMVAAAGGTARRAAP